MFLVKLESLKFQQFYLLKFDFFFRVLTWIFLKLLHFTFWRYIEFNLNHQLAGAGRTRARHHHESDKPTSLFWYVCIFLLGGYEIMKHTVPKVKGSWKLTVVIYKYCETRCTPNFWVRGHPIWFTPARGPQPTC